MEALLCFVLKVTSKSHSSEAPPPTSRGSDQSGNPIKTPDNGRTLELTLISASLELQPWSSFKNTNYLIVSFRCGLIQSWKDVC